MQLTIKRLGFLATAAAATCIFSAACDTSAITKRLWTPEVIDIEAEVDTPLASVDLLECFVTDEQPAVIRYHADKVGDDDKKTIILEIESRGHEDRDLCFREVLLGKLGGVEVQP